MATIYAKKGKEASRKATVPVAGELPHNLNHHPQEIALLD